MKFIKWLFIILLTLVVLLIAGGFVLSYFYKDEIVSKVKTDINKNFDATIDFGAVDLSFLRSFPDFNLQLKDLNIKGQDAFEGITLVDAKNIELDLDVMSVVNADSPIQINTIQFTEPNIHVMVLKNGKANYDIAKATEEAEETTSYNFKINLEKYNIVDGHLTYDDRAGDLFLELKDMDHEGTGNFTETIFDLVTKTNIAEISAKTGGITYLRKAKGDLDMTLNADLDQMKFTLKDNELMVNALKLKADGFVNMLKNGDIDMDLKFDAPGNSFKNFLSLIPSAFTKDFADVVANGNLAFNGYAKGIYNAEKNKMPKFKIYLDIANGDFKYPSLPMGVKDIFAKININSPSSDFDKMVIDIPNFNMNLGNNPFEARLNLKNPISDPNIDTKINGIINLTDLSKAFPMEDVQTLNGVITADLVANTRMSYIDRQQYERVKMDGTMKIENLNYVATGLPKVNIKTTNVAFTPQNAKIDNFIATLGKSDIEAKGTLNNILAYLSPEKTMTGKFSVRSNYFDLNEWITEEEETAQTAPTTAPGETTEVFDRFDFEIDAVMDKVDYDIYKLSNLSANGNFSPTRLNMDNFALRVSNSDIKGDGELRNIFAYVFDNETLEGDINMTSKYFDLNQLMADMETGAPQAKTIADEELEPLVIPEGVAVNINAKIDKLDYTNMALKNIRGKMVIADQAINIDKATANTLGGKMTMSGGYDSKNTEKPGFDMDFDISQFSFQESFKKLNTIRALAPIVKFMEGKFDTKLKLSGEVGKDMMPDLNTLTADGFFQTLDAVLTSFKPLENLGEKLNISAFKTLRIKDTKNWFTVKDGKVNIAEFDYAFQDIAMKISGEHGLSQDMDYNIKAKIPSKLIGKGKVGNATKTGLKFLNDQASKIGIDLNVGEFVNVLINMQGSITSPKLNVKLLSSEGKAATIKDVAKEVVNTVKDSVTTVVTEKVKETKADLVAKMNKEIDSVNSRLNPRIKKLEEEADAKAEALKKRKQQEIDKIKNEGYKQADLLVKKAGNNPFKKKAAEIAAKQAKKKADKIAEAASAKIDGQVLKTRQTAQKPIDKLIKERDNKIAAIRKKYE